MRRQHDRVARLDGDQNFEDSCRGRIRRRNNAGDNAARAGDLNYIFRFADDTDGAQVLEIVPDIFGGKTIFLLLVGGNAVTGFFDGHGRHARRLAQRRLRHRFADAVDPGLIEPDQLCLGPMRGIDQVAGLLH